MTDEERGGDAAVEEGGEVEGTSAEGGDGGGDVAQAPGTDEPVDPGPEEQESTGSDAQNAGVPADDPTAEGAQEA